MEDTALSEVDDPHPTMGEFLDILGLPVYEWARICLHMASCRPCADGFESLSGAPFPQPKLTVPAARN